MILERALLPVRPGQEAEFEAAFEQAKEFIAGSPGFISATLSRCIEFPSQFLLLVEWETLEAHTQGFRGSPAFDQWRALTHPFYEPPAEVWHYTQVSSA